MFARKRGVPARRQRVFPATDSTARFRANSAHVKQSRPDAGLNVQVKVLKTFKSVPCSLFARACSSSKRLPSDGIDSTPCPCFRSAPQSGILLGNYTDCEFVPGGKGIGKYWRVVQVAGRLLDGIGEHRRVLAYTEYRYWIF